VNDRQARSWRVPPADAVQAVENETADRLITGIVTLVPLLLLGIAAWQVWNEALRWSDIIVFAVMYVGVGLGVTVGFHRLFTHRSFKTGPRTRAILGALGSMAIEGPLIAWVADHRKHHACSDEHGDPHSPHVGHGHGWASVLRGLLHAHIGWIFIHTQRGCKERFAQDLSRDPVAGFIDRSFPLWGVLGLALPFALGVAIGGTMMTGLTAMLWGGAVRVFLVHHVTYSVNSLCHMFGRQPFETGDESRNLWPLALPTFGEAWHNNHHAFPSSASHGLRRSQVDLSAMVIGAMEKVGLAWDVVRPDSAQMAARAAA
jgi:stearoyl-CoA desaturase (delta-9 desaturase)